MKIYREKYNTKRSEWKHRVKEDLYKEIRMNKQREKIYPNRLEWKHKERRTTKSTITIWIYRALSKGSDAQRGRGFSFKLVYSQIIQHTKHSF